MAGIGITITGGDRLNAHLDALLQHMKGEMESVAVVGALPVLNKAKQGTRVKTGTAKRSEHIGGHVDQSPDTRIHADEVDYGEVSKPIITADSATVFIGSNLSYIPTLEYGRAMSSGAASVMAKYGGTATGTGDAMFRRAMDDPGTQKASARQSELAFKLLLKKAFGGL